jgi:hypothetical protein
MDEKAFCFIGAAFQFEINQTYQKISKPKRNQKAKITHRISRRIPKITNKYLKGETMPEYKDPRDKRINFRMTSEDLYKLKVLAALHESSLTQAVVQLINEKYEESQSKNKI